MLTYPRRARRCPLHPVSGWSVPLRYVPCLLQFGSHIVFCLVSWNGSMHSPASQAVLEKLTSSTFCCSVCQASSIIPTSSVWSVSETQLRADLLYRCLVLWRKNGHVAILYRPNTYRCILRVFVLALCVMLAYTLSVLWLVSSMHELQSGC
ncbi:hypothetical protein BD310DRAFT_931448 [Dichomitus squalens]|uniref:Uncharacterized protein n=1 Tax=Dichomitus squalens TaxID=114155 RepID=A0A4Q9PQ09_9APHY|nr:hypothetical protein BD310DRAFT_931448 [Dichomitus squalens]